MTARTGNGATSAFTLTDDEVLALVRNVAHMSTTPGDTFPTAMAAWKRLQARAEDILNDQRASRR